MLGHNSIGSSSDPLGFTLRGASILDHAADILEQRGFCTSLSGAVNVLGEPCEPNDEEATAWTSSGAVFRAWFELRKAFPESGGYSDAMDILNRRTWEEYHLDRFGVLAKELRDAGIGDTAIGHMRRWAMEVFRAHGYGEA